MDMQQALDLRYKLIALDMDGTVLNDRSEVTIETQKWLAKAKQVGVTVMFATGRGIQSVRPYTQELGWTGPIVTVNGSEVWKTPNDLLVRHRMPADQILRMRQIALDQDTWYWAYDTERVHNRDNWTDTGIAEREWLKFGFYTENADKLAKIRKELEAWDVFEVTNSHPSNIELNPRGVNKASGIAEVCRLLGIGMEQVVAMGDSLNDIAAIRAAGLGIAMGNAQEEVKQVADDVTFTNGEDGVAAAIKKHIFQLS